MYHSYFGLSESPFSIAVNPRYLFMSARHRDALAHLLYGVGSGGGFILLTGEVGTGKTTINRALLAQLPDNVDLAIILNPALSATELLAAVCDEFALEYSAESSSLKTLTDCLHHFLLSNFKRGRKTVLMIDEAQHLDFEVLEQIRLLTNLETDEEKLLQIILIGQPELAAKLARPELRQLNQRITARYNLEPLNRQETGAYINHRLSVAGLPPGHDIFSSAAIQEVHKQSGGVPRLINLVCERVLLGAYGKDQNRVGRGLVRAAAQEALGSSAQSAAGLTRWTAIIGVTALIGITAVLGTVFLNGQQLSQAQENPKEPVIAVVEPPPRDLKGLANAEGFQLENAVANRWLWQLTLDDPVSEDFCMRNGTSSVMCVRERSDTWDQLVALNRPVVLDTRGQDKFSSSILIVGFADRAAWTISPRGVVKVPLIKLAGDWTGAYRYLWLAPPAWNGSLGVGDSGPAVAALAELFAKLDGQSEAITTNVFTPFLETRVKLFQRSLGLLEDGVVTREVLLALDNEVSPGQPLNQRLERADMIMAAQ